MLPFPSLPTAEAEERTLLGFGLVSLALVSSLASCASPRAMAWDRRALEAAELRERGDLERADDRYRELLESARNLRDQRHARLQLAEIEVERGRFEKALEEYRSIWSEPRRDAIGARAMWRASKMLDGEMDRKDRAEHLREKLITRYPTSSWSENAVDARVDSIRTGDDAPVDELRRFVRRLHGDVEDTPIADHLHFRAAMALREIGADEAAESLYRRQLRRYPDGSRADDAEWELAQLYLDAQRWNEAREILRRVARRVERSWFAGTYTSPWASPARYRLGLLHLTHLSNYDRALEHFRRHLRDFGTNRLTDDAAWGIVEAHRLADHRDRYRRELRAFLEDHPESRHARTARERLDALAPESS